jgi:hypothetical protein
MTSLWKDHCVGRTGQVPAMSTREVATTWGPRPEGSGNRGRPVSRVGPDRGVYAISVAAEMVGMDAQHHAHPGGLRPVTPFAGTGSCARWRRDMSARAAPPPRM